MQNWVNGIACLARAETAYLLHSEDLLNVAQSDDGATIQLKIWVEDNLIRFFERFSTVSNCHLSLFDLEAWIDERRIFVKMLQEIHMFTFFSAF